MLYKHVGAWLDAIWLAKRASFVLDIDDVNVAMINNNPVIYVQPRLYNPFPLQRTAILSGINTQPTVTQLHQSDVDQVQTQNLNLAPQLINKSWIKNATIG